MKIDLATLERMAAAGATGEVILTTIRPVLERLEAQKQRRKPMDADRYHQKKEANSKIPHVESSGNWCKRVETSETPQARLFNEGKSALLALKIVDSRAGALIAQWLKFAKNDHALVLEVILNARDEAVQDAPGWILATLKGKLDGQRANGTRARGPVKGAGDTFIAAMAGELSKRADSRLSRGQADGWGNGPDAVADDPPKLEHTSIPDHSRINLEADNSARALAAAPKHR